MNKFFFQAEDGIRDVYVTGVQTCAFRSVWSSDVCSSDLVRPRMKFMLLILMIKKEFFFFNDTATTEIYTLSLHDALPILEVACMRDLTHVSNSW